MTNSPPTEATLQRLGFTRIGTSFYWSRKVGHRRDVLVNFTPDGLLIICYSDGKKVGSLPTEEELVKLINYRTRKVLAEAIQFASRACEHLRQESEAAGISAIHFRQMAGAVHSFAQATEFADELLPVMQSICPSAFNSGTLDLAAESEEP